jgi:RNAse (barnase) inhibitor barstar
VKNNIDKSFINEYDKSLDAETILGWKRNKVVIYIEGNNIKTKQYLFTEFKTKLNFPPYFGKNWDAFIDSFSTESNIVGKDSVIIIKDADIFKNNNQDLFCKFIEIMVFIYTQRLKDCPESFQLLLENVNPKSLS